jgi:hypothetical protein
MGQGHKSFFWIDEELIELMGCKIIKGNELALIILILILSLAPVSCNNNSSINSSQDSVSNATGLYQPPIDSIPETKNTDLAENFDQLDWLEKIISIIAGALAIVAILVGFYLGLFPNARNGARKRIIGLLKRIGLHKSDPEEVSAGSDPEKEPSKNIVKRRRRTHAQQAAGHPRRRRMKMEPGRADPSLS